MKSLAEVIEAYEYCIDNNYRDCRGCPYGCEDGESGCIDAEEKKDALHYLKEYRTILPLVPSLINTAIAVQKKGKTIG